MQKGTLQPRYGPRARIRGFLRDETTKPCSGMMDQTKGAELRTERTTLAKPQRSDETLSDGSSQRRCPALGRYKTFQQCEAPAAYASEGPVHSKPELQPLSKRDSGPSNVKARPKP